MIDRINKVIYSFVAKKTQGLNMIKIFYKIIKYLIYLAISYSILGNFYINKSYFNWNFLYFSNYLKIYSKNIFY